jgi:two-component system chemotaxis response regulator CheY
VANILIVDDSKTSRKMLRNILEENGHTVVDEAVDGEDGVKKFMEHKPDVVTLDITMPRIDGIEALSMIKAVNPAAKVIMLTAAGQKNKMIDCIKLGADEFLTKPFDKQEIVSVVERVLQ